jgi:hypothetical protein
LIENPNGKDQELSELGDDAMTVASSAIDPSVAPTEQLATESKKLLE